ncbi:YceI family protein [Dyadobacter tibetensis]|uniref:YceI family protein n=1 Tax=Dyadobacter tibetensis TaxID=1211851 RepID=UPI00047023BA|nr:YceI family protein [Dyadobacter tibetensis]
MKKELIPLIFASTILWNCTDHEPVKTYQLREQESVAEWKGYLRTGYFNEGSIGVRSESLTVSDQVITGGTFTLPLSSLVNFNLPNEDLKQELIHHLQSPDFFNMALHPTMKFKISGLSPYTGSGEDVVSGANYEVKGDLSILGITHEISFPAKIVFKGDDFTVEGLVKVDRTKWGILYGTDESQPAENIIEKVIDIHLKLEGGKL